MSVHITSPRGDPIERVASHVGFRDITLADELEDHGEAAITVDEFLLEKHHHYYGGPWSMGRHIFDRMVERGLKPQDHVLDLGCGAGRIGIWLINYLEPGKYVGVDVHYRSLAAFARYEIPLHRLEGKEPRLILDGDFRLDEIQTSFDWICDCSVTAHLTAEQAVNAYRAILRVMSDRGRIGLHHKPKMEQEQLNELGLKISHSSELSYPMMVGSNQWPNSTSLWSEIQRK